MFLRYQKFLESISIFAWAGVFILATFMIACSNPTTKAALENKHFAGFLPCADCEGLEYHLQLFEDGTFRTESFYLGKSDAPLIVEGLYTIEKDTVLVIRDGQHIQHQFLIGEKELIWLTQEGNLIDSEFAYQYILKASTPEMMDLAFVDWQLEQLDMLKIVQLPNEERPLLRFLANGTVNGYTGCNRLFGEYTIADGKINFAQMATTRRFCAPTNDSLIAPSELESQFLSLINSKCDYTLTSGGLSLSNPETGIKATMTR
jgi:heat shock protein HslJ